MIKLKECEFNAIWKTVVFVLAVGMFFPFSWMSTHESMINGSTRALADLYNFSESECAAWGNVTPPAPAVPRAETKCVLYCHTIQIRDGETCETIQVNRTVQACAGRCSGTIEIGPDGRAIGWKYVDGNISSVTVTANVTTFCATPEQIAKARSLVG